MSDTDANEATADRPRILLAYLGVQISSSKPFHTFLPLDEDWAEKDLPGHESESVRFYKSRLGSARPGAVISIEHDPDSETRTVYTETARVIGHLPDEIATEWQAKSQAIQTAHELQRSAKKEGSRDLPLEVLEPLRSAYTSLRNKNQRTALLARVVAYITK